MKQVVFAIALLAMASLTGCLNTEDSPVDDTTDDTTSDTTEDNTDTTQDDTKDDELIEPVGTDGGYTPPENSNIRVDNGIQGTWEESSGDEFAEWVPCTEQGWTIVFDEYTKGYCDLDNRYDHGPQLWVNKTGKSITIECIKHYEEIQYPELNSRYSCKDMQNNNFGNYRDFAEVWGFGAYLEFTSVEGFKERVHVVISQTSKIQGDSGNGTKTSYNHNFFQTEINLEFEPVSFTIIGTSGGEMSAGAENEDFLSNANRFDDYEVTERYF